MFNALRGMEVNENDRDNELLKKLVRYGKEQV